MKPGNLLWVVLALCFLCAAPAVASETKLLKSDGEVGDGFGGAYGPFGHGAVAIDGDTLVVGASKDDVGSNPDQGSATVFRRSGVAWVEEVVLTSSSGSASAGFGGSVAMDGDVLVVSSWAAGKATVFRWTGVSWVEETELTGPGGFGNSVAVSGDAILVGAPGWNAAFAFRWNGLAWVEEAELTSSSPTGLDQFGGTVALCGDVAVVGAPTANFGGHNNAGTATVFRWSGSAWTEEQILSHGDPAGGDLFGSAVSVDGDVVVVGAVSDEDGDGSATVFRWNGTTWVDEALLQSGGTEDFGAMVDVSGSVITVGAPLTDVGLQGSSAGAAFVFRWDGLAWSEQARLTASDANAHDWFGSGIAVDGEVALIAAYRADGPQQQQDQGAVYVVDVSPVWFDEGCALAGVAGNPALVACGPLSSASLNAIDLSNAAPSATSGLFVALGPVSPAPFKGGLLKPIPFALPPILIPTSTSGTISLPFVMPSGAPSGTDLWLQWAIQDVAAANGVALSNAVRGTTP